MYSNFGYIKIDPQYYLFIFEVCYIIIFLLDY